MSGKPDGEQNDQSGYVKANQRQECPNCGLLMRYAWPGSVLDPELNLIRWRFQKCQNADCGNRAITDVKTGQVWWIARPTTFEDFVEAYLPKGKRE